MFLKKIPWVGEGSKYADYHVFGGGVMNQHRWENKITQWIQDDRNIDNKLSEPFVQFFTLVFENTSCPAKAWFGIHGNTISLVVGGIFLAAIIKSGNNKGIWLLLQDTPEIDGWKSWQTKSTKFASKPLKWFHTSALDKVYGVLGNSEIWHSYKIASKRILDFPVVASDRDKVQISRKKERLSKIYAYPKNPFDEIDEYKNESSYTELNETERQAVIQSRIGQGKFRTDLINYWNGCAVTGCKRFDILRASHIKPWSKATNEERLDKYNGLLLVPNLDVVFDAGYISFGDDGTIIISHFLIKEDQDMLGIHQKLIITRVTEQHVKYLQYHRNHLFKGNSFL